MKGRARNSKVRLYEELQPVWSLDSIKCTSGVTERGEIELNETGDRDVGLAYLTVSEQSNEVFSLGCFSSVRRFSYARLRDMGDELAKIIKEYANNEIVNKSLSSGLENLSITLTAIEEYRNCEVQRLEAKVIGELCQYESICKHAREELKHTMNVREKEMSRKKVLDKAKERQPFNRQHVTYAESELIKASAEMSRTAKGLSEQTEFFERRKLQQLKTLLMDFVMIEMTFHTKAVELLTVAYQQIDNINEKADLENFKRKLRSPEKQVSTGISARSSSLASLMNQQSPIKDTDAMVRTF
ncbi:unnamed protein product [Euphydryas editha]|uniref:Protein FAM92A n=1 Tax=Euphydryas editha TaxID=104508 RepID=A0AAU9V3V5_EUPED|nr:unnamed protein product [Euphydryas editha]